MDDLEHFILLIYVGGLKFLVGPGLLVVAVEGSIITIFFIICDMRHHSSWTSDLRTSLHGFVVWTSTDGSSVTKTIDIGQNFCYRRTVLHFHATLFSGLVIRIKRSVLNACEFIVIGPRWLILVGRVFATTGDSHMMIFIFGMGICSVVLIFVIRVLAVFVIFSYCCLNF